MDKPKASYSLYTLSDSVKLEEPYAWKEEEVAENMASSETVASCAVEQVQSETALSSREPWLVEKELEWMELRAW